MLIVGVFLMVTVLVAIQEIIEAFNDFIYYGAYSFLDQPILLLILDHVLGLALIGCCLSSAP